MDEFRNNPRREDTKRGLSHSSLPYICLTADQMPLNRSQVSADWLHTMSHSMTDGLQQLCQLQVSVFFLTLKEELCPSESSWTQTSTFSVLPKQKMI